jgi:lipopolysaccharide transport system ATP-binding protein
LSYSIEIEQLCKQFQLGSIGTQNLRHWLQKAMRRAGGLEAAEKELFWALRDISFNVKQGEVIGLIGRNGAGKSTLLKIISRISEPSSGKITLNGRVSSLLEVGTGFHPELTGRENIFLNGSILGMTRKEIKSKFDEIVDFSGVEQFLDTPVKRYSSGMYVRLAFSVAAHLEPEILLVDEVLAVGDHEFQKKCLGKMGDISSSGRTIIFVSHNMGAVSELCSRAILFEQGKLITDGTVEQTISHYIEGSGVNTGGDFEPKPNGKAWFTELELLRENKLVHTLDLNHKCTLRMSFEVAAPTEDLDIAVILMKGTQRVFFSIDRDQLAPSLFNPGQHTFEVHVPEMYLTGVDYHFDLYLRRPSDGSHYDAQTQRVHFNVDELSLNTHHKGYAQKRGGLTIFPGEWKKMTD